MSLGHLAASWHAAHKNRQLTMSPIAIRFRSRRPKRWFSEFCPLLSYGEKICSCSPRLLHQVEIKLDPNGFTGDKSTHSFRDPLSTNAKSKSRIPYTSKLFQDFSDETTHPVHCLMMAKFGKRRGFLNGDRQFYRGWNVVPVVPPFSPLLGPIGVYVIDVALIGLLGWGFYVHI